MSYREAAFAPSPEKEESETSVREALNLAGLFDVEAPKKGTEAYDRLLKAAENYISEVKRGETSRVAPPSADAENYFSKPKPSSSSDSIRREYHNQMAMMLMGSSRKELSKEDADKISKFAAYVTGHEEYVGSW